MSLLRRSLRRRHSRRLATERLECRRLLVGDLQVRFAFLESDGGEADSLLVGESYILRAHVQDIRTGPTGVSQAYFDVSYDADLISTTGSVAVDAAYRLNQSGDASTPGLIDEAGGIDADRIAPSPPGQEMVLFNIPVQADQAGTLELTPGLSGSAPLQPFFFGSFQAVRFEDIDFVGTTISVLEEITPEVSITAGVNAVEGGGDGRFVITQSATSAATTTVEYSITGSAVSGQDFEALSGQATISAGETTTLIDVVAIDDALLEPDENLRVTLTAVSGGDATLAPTNTEAEILIQDNESATISVSATSQAAEGGSNGVFTITQTQASTTDTAIEYSLSGTATEGDDYPLQTGIVTIAAGDTQATVAIAPVDDSSVEGSESVVLTLDFVTSDADVTIGSPSSAQVDIADNDSAQVRVTADQDGDENGPTPGSFLVSQTEPTAIDTVITLSFSGAAVAGQDYSQPQATVTILAGQTSAMVDIAVLDDGLVEGAEAVAIELTSIQSGEPGLVIDSGQSTATLNIADDDQAQVSIQRVEDGSEAGPTAGRLRVVQSAASATPTVVNYTVGGTAQSGSDFEPLSGSVTIDAGATQADLVVTIIDDAANEGVEDLTITLTEITSGAPPVTLDAAQSSATIQIADNEQSLVSIRRVSDGSEAGPAPATFRIEQTTTTAAPTVVAYSITGSATSGDDFQALSGTATIPAGQTSVDVNAVVVDDALIEGTETIVLTLDEITSGDSQLAIDQTADAITLNIIDDDTSRLSISGGDGAESVNGALLLTLTQASPEATVVAYQVSGTATSGDDFAALPGQITIPAGETTATIDISVVQDELVETDQTVQVVLQQITSGSSQVSIDPAMNSATWLIEDDDASLVGIAAFGDGAEASEVSGAFRVTLTAASDEAVVVDYTVSGSATPGADYQTLSGQATVPAGAVSVDIPVAVIDDALTEGTETVVATLSTVAGSGDVSIDGANNSASIEIVDDETPGVSIRVENAAAEGGQGGRFVVSQNFAAATPTVIAISTSGSATGGADYRSPPNQITIPAGETSVTVDLVTLDDDLAEGNETVRVTLDEIVSGDPALMIVAGADSAELEIQDNETGLIRIDIDSVSVAEDGTATATIRQDGITGQDTVIRLQIFGEATAGQDFQAITEQATITAGNESVSIPINILDDTLVEPSESLELAIVEILEGASVLALDPNADEVALAITDNDAAQISLGATADATEGGADGSVEVVLSQPSSTDTVVGFVVNGDAEVDVLSAAAGQFLIPAGQTSVTFDVRAVDDSIVEADELARITLTSIVSGASSITIDAAANDAELTVTDNDTSLVSVRAASNGAEPNGDARFAIEMTNASDTTTTIGFTLGGDATSGEDYQAPAALEVAIPAGQTSAEITLATIDDDRLEGAESLVASLTTVTGRAAIGVDATNDEAAAEIADDETGLVRITPDRNGAEGGDTGRFLIEVDGVSDQPLTVNYTISGQASAGDDFEALSGQATIPASATQAVIEVNVVDDELFEGTESLTATLTNVSGNPLASVDSQNNAATIDILDNDTITVSLQGPSEVNESIGTLAYTIQLDRAASEPLTVEFAFEGPAANSADGTLPPTMTTLAANTTSAVVNVAVNDDNLVEGTEELRVRLTSIVGAPAGVVLSDTERQVATAIQDNDSASLTISAPTTVGEGPAATWNITLTLSNPSSTDTVVAFEFSGEAISGDDFTPPASLTIPAETTTLLVPVAIMDDADVEPTESITLTLTGLDSANDGVALGDVVAATAQLSDNDSATIAFTAADSGILEAAGQASIPVSLSIPSGGVLRQAVTVDVVVAGGTATGDDFQLGTASITFAAGAGDGATQDVVLTLVDDETREDPESVILRLENLDGPAGAALGATAEHELAITDDPLTASIAGQLWSDADLDRVRDPAEAPVPGVRLTVSGVDLQGQTVSGETFSDSDGRYRFDGLPGGTYTVTAGASSLFHGGGPVVGNAGGQAVGDSVEDVVIDPAEEATGYHFVQGALQARLLNARMFRAASPPIAMQTRSLTVDEAQANGDAETAARVAANAAPSYRRIGDTVRVFASANAAETVEVIPARNTGAASGETPTVAGARDDEHVVAHAGGRWTFPANEVSRIELVGVGADDRLVLRDTPASDAIQAAGDTLRANFANGALLVEASGFASIQAISSSGDDELDAEAVDFVLEQSGGWN